MPKWCRTLVFGALIGVLGAVFGVSALGQWLDEQVGLNWLFELRGPRPAPADAVIISIDRESATALGLPASARRWPRELHGELIERLEAAGVGAIVFDVFFQESRPGDTDQLLAQAMARSGDVVLFEYLTKRVGAVDDEQGATLGRYNLEQRIQPTPILQQAAAATGPFPLPKVPARVDQVWRFKPEIGDVPTLPVLALQLHAREGYQLLRDALVGAGVQAADQLAGDWEALRSRGQFHDPVKFLRHAISAEPGLVKPVRDFVAAQAASPSTQRAALVLLEAYSGPASAYLNFYGGPGHLPTLSYHRVIADAGWEKDVHNKLAFIGFAERFEGEEKDSFHTVYASETHLTSGVEILATAFGNLVDGSALRPLTLGLQAALLFGLGLIAGVLFRSVTGAWTIPAALLAGGGYLWVAHSAFAGFVWLPLATPLLVQLPVAVVGALLLQYLTTQRERRRIREAFGYHLPLRVVDQLASGTRHVAADSDRMFGICLATDAGRYTSLSERLDPGVLHDLMNRYYGAVFGPIRGHGGVVSDVVGDAVLAIWAAAQNSAGLREQACIAALELNTAVEQFNERETHGPLTTRIGVHCGELVLGHVGALDHYEYRAVGDIVNTATRIEGLNKQLGTRMLVSESVARGLDATIATRPLGVFRLAGKSHTTDIAELLGPADELSRYQREWLDTFADALDAFRQQHWRNAVAAFEHCLELVPGDGPSRFYLQHIQERAQADLDEEFAGVIVMNKK